MKKHSDPPWRVIQRKNYIAVSNGNGVVARTNDLMDAQLISFAPELLYLLEGIVRKIEAGQTPVAALASAKSVITRATNAPS